jgi:hypothetical protein
MKFRFNTIIFGLFLLTILSACEHDINMETTVHSDGSLDKTIRLSNTDSLQNILGLRQEDGWIQTVQEVELDEDDELPYFGTKPAEPSSPKDSAARETKEIRSFQRHFSSAEEANTALATPIDSLFRVTSTFEKKFRWFYTYIYYADTYHAINRMGYPATNYTTAEDYAFIDRLPGEGKRIT